MAQILKAYYVRGGYAFNTHIKKNTDCIWHSFAKMPSHIVTVTTGTEMKEYITEKSKQEGRIRLAIVEIHTRELIDGLNFIRDLNVDIEYFTSFLNRNSFQMFYLAQKNIFIGTNYTPPIGYLALMQESFLYLNDFDSETEIPAARSKNVLVYINPGTRDDFTVCRKFKRGVYNMTDNYTNIFETMYNTDDTDVEYSRKHLHNMYLTMSSSNQFVRDTVLPIVIREHEFLTAIFRNESIPPSIIPLNSKARSFVDYLVLNNNLLLKMLKMVWQLLDLTETTGNGMLHQYSCFYLSHIFRNTTFYTTVYKMRHRAFRVSGMGCRLCTSANKKLYW